MFKKTHFSRVICSLFFTALCANPVIAGSSKTGQDWYCSDPVAHKHYEKHLKEHLSHSSKIITEQLDAIYGNSNFSAEEKQEKALNLIDKYLSKLKAGTGD